MYESEEEEEQKEVGLQSCKVLKMEQITRDSAEEIIKRLKKQLREGSDDSSSSESDSEEGESSPDRRVHRLEPGLQTPEILVTFEDT